MSDPPGANCPECGDGAERVISAGAGFVFKGEGFYITDHRSEDYKKKARVEAPGGEPDPNTTHGRGERKADKPESKTKGGREAGLKAELGERGGE